MTTIKPQKTDLSVLVSVVRGAIVHRKCRHQQLNPMWGSLPDISPPQPVAPAFLLNSPTMDEQSDFTSRLLFLYNVVADVQGTIRFLDTKAAFCVTLLTAMMAAAFQLSSPHPRFPNAHLVLLVIFGILTLVCASICVRVIFPTIHHQGSFSVAVNSADPAFFLVPKWKRRHIWDTLGNRAPEGMEAAHAMYTASVMAAADADLVQSMCDEVVTISSLRQVKSDRLHLAIQLLSLTVLAFFLQLAI
jgi:hypothetical protein